MAAMTSHKARLCLLLIGIGILLFRLPLAAVPFFNVDEGIGAVVANSLLDGGVYYRDSIDQRGPVAYYVYALIFLVFGRNNMLAVHVSLTALVLLLTYLIYRIGASLWGRRAGCWAALFFAVFSYAYDTRDTLAFHTEWVAVLCTTIAAYWFLKFITQSRPVFLFLSGVAFSLAFFTKQFALADFFVAALFCFIFLKIEKASLRHLSASIGSLVAGFLLVAAVIVGYYAWRGALAEFRFYFWDYNFNYYTPALSAFQRLKLAVLYFIHSEGFIRANFLLPVLFISAAGMAVARFLSGGRRLDRPLLIEFYLVVWGLVSYASGSYTGRHFAHYFFMLLPPFCLLNGRTMSLLYEVVPALTVAAQRTALRLFLLVLVLTGIVFPLGQYSFRLNVREVFEDEDKVAFVPRTLYQLTDYIKQHSSPGDKIFVWGFYPEIYILADRTPASRYTYCNFLTGLLPWVNVEPDKDTSASIVPDAWPIFMEELRRNQPRYFVDTSIGNRHYYGKYPLKMFPSLWEFLRTGYVLEKVFYTWGGEPCFALFRKQDG